MHKTNKNISNRLKCLHEQHPLLIVICVVLVFVTSTILLISSTYVFTFSTQTEVAECDINQDVSLEHCDLSIWLPHSTNRGFEPRQNARIEIQTGTILKAIRKRQGPLFLELKRIQPSESVGRIYTAGGPEPESLPSGTVLRIDISSTVSSNAISDNTFILPLRGNLSIGEDVAPKVTEILLSGKVQIIEQLRGLGNAMFSKPSN